MAKKTTVFYWSPSIVNIATTKAVINSAYSLKKFSNLYDCKVFNYFGEFEKYRDKMKKKNIDLIDFYNNKIFNFFPKHGKVLSRISFIGIFFLGIIPLYNRLKYDKPDYIILHLITSLPLILLILFKFKTKFILRISGLPRLNFFRRLLWKLASKKIYLITCPTKNTYRYIKKLNICEDKKLHVLFDPVINIKEIKYKQKEEIKLKQNYYLAIGRLTFQKNFLFLCKCFKKLLINHPNINLCIIGEGEQYSDLDKYIKINKLEKNIKLLGYVENVFPFIKSSKGFILSSLWEDPGFVLIEAAICRVPIFSSDAKPGPHELVKDNYNGTTFINNDLNDFIKKFDFFLRNSENNKLVLQNLKFCKNFTIFNHYKTLIRLLN